MFFKSCLRSSPVALAQGVFKFDKDNRGHNYDKFTDDLTMFISSCIGTVFSYIEEDNGVLIRRLQPLKQKSILGGFRGANRLNFHTEIAWCKLRPDYVCLVCARTHPEQSVTTSLVDINSAIADLETDVLEILSSPFFQIGLPESMRQFVSEELYWSKPLPILVRAGLQWEGRFNLDFINPLNIDAEQALNEFIVSIQKCRQDLVLKEGDILVFNNNTALHGRSAFTPRFNKDDRLLKQTYIKADLAPYEKYLTTSPGTYNALKALSI